MLVLEVNDIVQVTPVDNTLINLKYHGCIGFITHTTQVQSVVAFFSPIEDDQEAYSTSKTFENLELSIIGKPVLVPN